ncbi:MAG: ABC transporter ATP-binding protein [Actinomycetota bacterium]
MTDETWLEAFDHALEATGVAPLDRVSARLETEGFLADAGVSAVEHFGQPEVYATELASALGSDRRSGGRGVDEASQVVAETDRVSKSYRGASILREVSLRVSGGDVAVLTGPNGAGKSTLLRILAGLERPDAGTVRLHGDVGYVPQDGGLDPFLSPAEHFELFATPTGFDRRIAEREGNRLAMELGWDAASAPLAGELSGGTAQKLAVITALLAGPEILLLDEPCQGMDADSQRRFWSLLWAWQDAGRSAVVASHAPDALAKASMVVEIGGVSTR